MSQHTNITFRKNVAAFLLKARGDRSQAEFARFLGLPNQQKYQRYESGRVMPPADVLHTIATKIGVSESELLTGLAPSVDVGYQLEEAISEPRPQPAPADCMRYLEAFLRTCGGDLGRLGWTYHELKERFPLDKWSKQEAATKTSLAPSSKPASASGGLLKKAEDAHDQYPKHKR